MLLEGYAAHQLLLQLHDYILGQMTLGNEQKAIIFDKIAVRQREFILFNIYLLSLDC